MNQNNQNNRNNNNRNGKSRQNNQNRQAEEKESMDKKAPMQYQIRKTKETKEGEFKCEIDGVMERTKVEPNFIAQKKLLKGSFFCYLKSSN